MKSIEGTKAAPGLNQRKRQFYEEWSLSLGRVCVRLGFKPNYITAVSLLCAIISGVFFWRGQWLWGVVWMVITSFTDMLDGSTARAGKMGTVFGGILDHVSDRYGEFFILAGITLSGRVAPGWGLFALFGMIIASYTRAAAESMGKIENCAVGIMGRLEKFILIIIGSLLEYFLPVGAFPRSGWLELALIVVGATSYITSVQRMVYTYKVLGDKREV
ncbi:MAG TPA: CDP-alcohol phosphatidyltransferase family protein [candidate division Zixibacteria bacterium]|nr:CDP-alcohol phosphatidyltransferase family protein [candidate division Zixibacteria bacterium]MDD4917392.1 CDP-alcohol phosphatidyltransferase family protein [candidate division Zixibacteria bacterium]MDM7972390.1 CDP-alcohol phosphatidyltransferase family protein [candidate division Zixibacteria bacterium]HOD66194.1 CDP-alcohol phosphatidyltransferase family protein [candidate division Zixibacteria bacterium]HOZ08384.1 CDP-alcohol phosphatidyltransferase family protein [candidate division Z